MEKPSPILPHMPPHIKQLVVDSTDTSSRSSLRYCSKEFNNLAEKSGDSYRSLQLNFNMIALCAMVSFSPDEHRITQLEYRPHRDGYSLRNLQNYQRELTFLASLSHQIAVKEFHFNFNGTQDDVLKILPYLKPGTLEKICLECSYSTYQFSDIELNKVAETEQWKQARKCGVYGSYMSLPFEKWAHFTETIFTVDEFTVDAVRMLLEELVKLTDWKRTRIQFRRANKQQLIEYLTQLGTVKTATRTKHVFELSPPNSFVPLKVDLIPDMIELIKHEE